MCVRRHIPRHPSQECHRLPRRPQQVQVLVPDRQCRQFICDGGLGLEPEHQRYVKTQIAQQFRRVTTARTLTDLTHNSDHFAAADQLFGKVDEHLGQERCIVDTLFAGDHNGHVTRARVGRDQLFQIVVRKSVNSGRRRQFFGVATTRFAVPSDTGERWKRENGTER